MNTFERLLPVIELHVMFTNRGDTINSPFAGDARPEQVVESVATILEQETQSTIDEWLQRMEADNLLRHVPLGDEFRASHLPELFRELVLRLRVPLPAGTRALVSSGAVEHGQLRRKQGYTASMLVEESRLLQVSIFHTLRVNAHRLDFTLLLRDVMTIADEVDSQLAQAVESYNSKVGRRRRLS